MGFCEDYAYLKETSVCCVTAPTTCRLASNAPLVVVMVVAVVCFVSLCFCVLGMSFAVCRCFALQQSVRVLLLLVAVVDFLCVVVVALLLLLLLLLVWWQSSLEGRHMKKEDTTARGARVKRPRLYFISSGVCKRYLERRRLHHKNLYLGFPCCEKRQ